MFITDANKLREYYQTTGTLYYGSGNTTVLPPPVPGEGDPAAAPSGDGETSPGADNGDAGGDASEDGVQAGDG